MVAVVAALGGAARADEEVVELRYAAPAACPTREAVTDEIRARTPNVRLSGHARRVFAITIDRTAEGFRGTLVVDLVARKELSAPRCDDLATALALVTALAIDPAALAAPQPARSGPVLVWAFDAELGGMLVAGVAPEPMAAAVLGARAYRQRYQGELAAIIGHEATTTDAAQARFTWVAGRVSGCRRAEPAPVEVAVCGDVEAGAVRASARDIVNQRALTRLWLAAGLHAAARYPADARLFGQLQLGVSLPLTRDRYLFAPGVAIHDTPSVVGALVVGVGVRFP